MIWKSALAINELKKDYFLSKVVVLVVDPFHYFEVSHTLEEEPINMMAEGIYSKNTDKMTEVVLL